MVRWQVLKATGDAMHEAAASANTQAQGWAPQRSTRVMVVACPAATGLGSRQVRESRCLQPRPTGKEAAPGMSLPATGLMAG